MRVLKIPYKMNISLQHFYLDKRKYEDIFSFQEEIIDIEGISDVSPLHSIKDIDIKME